MKKNTKESITKDDSTKQAAPLMDLSVADEKADQVSGGSPKLFLFCANGKHY